MTNKLKSRKLWIAVISALLLAFNDQLGIIPQDNAREIVAIIVAYIVGQSAVDTIAEKNKTKEK